MHRRNSETELIRHFRKPSGLVRRVSDTLGKIRWELLPHSGEFRLFVVQYLRACPYDSGDIVNELTYSCSTKCLS